MPTRQDSSLSSQADVTQKPGGQDFLLWDVRNPACLIPINNIGERYHCLSLQIHGIVIEQHKASLYV